MIKVYYAFTTCNRKNNQVDERVCGSDRSLLSVKSLVSLIESINYVEEKKPKESIHYVRIFDDYSTSEHVEKLKRIAATYSNDYLKIEYTLTPITGQMNNYRSCYEWLADKDSFVYLVQDDYLFTKEAIYETIEVFFQILNETNSISIIDPCHQQQYWQVEYRNKSTPRAIIPAMNRFWIQTYNLSCSFFTLSVVLKEQWDFIEMFLALPSRGIDGGKLEELSLNYITTKRGVLALMPLTTLAFHMQSEHEEDLYIDWKPLWESIKI